MHIKIWHASYICVCTYEISMITFKRIHLARLGNRETSKSIYYRFISITILPHIDLCFSKYNTIPLNFNFTDTKLLYISYVIGLGMEYISYALYTVVKSHY